MEKIEIKWTSRAVKDLRKIYHFYTSLSGEEKAFKLIQKLLFRIELLSNKKTVKMGTLDEEFKHLKREYKKILEGNIKVTYRESTSDNIVYITECSIHGNIPQKTNKAL